MKISSVDKLHPKNCRAALIASIAGYRVEAIDTSEGTVVAAMSPHDAIAGTVFLFSPKTRSWLSIAGDEVACDELPQVDPVR